MVGFNHCISILNLSKIVVHIYTTGKNIHLFSIGYMINPSLKFNKTFRTQVETFLSYYFSIWKMKTIENCLIKNNTYVMASIMIYENNI